MRRAGIRVGLCLLSTFLALAPARAQDAPLATGAVSASARGEVTSGTGVLVRPPDASPLSQDIAAFIAAELRDRGYRVGQGDGYVMNFRLIRDVDSLRDRRAPLELRGDVGSASESTVELLYNFQVRRDERPPTPRGRPDRRRDFTLTLLDRDNQTVWDARVSARSASDDDYAVIISLLPAVLDRLGRQVIDERIP